MLVIIFIKSIFCAVHQSMNEDILNLTVLKEENAFYIYDKQLFFYLKELFEVGSVMTFFMSTIENKILRIERKIEIAFINDEIKIIVLDDNFIVAEEFDKSLEFCIRCNEMCLGCYQYNKNNKKGTLTAITLDSEENTYFADTEEEELETPERRKKEKRNYKRIHRQTPLNSTDSYDVTVNPFRTDSFSGNNRFGVAVRRPPANNDYRMAIMNNNNSESIEPKKRRTGGFFCCC